MNEQLKHFKKLVDQHDLTYNYSDDGSVWRRGQDERDKITQLADHLPRDQVVKIWNDAVDRKIKPGMGEHFKWRE